MTRRLRLVLLILLFGIPLPALTASVEILNAGPDNVAIDGFDTVAYFVEGQPVKGKPEIVVRYKGRDWLFSSVDNRDKFTESPESYEPQFNCFCAIAVSEGAAAEVDFVDGWGIHDGMLFLNWSVSVKEIFLQERSERTADAFRYWPEFYSDMKHGLRRIARHRDFSEVGIVHPQNVPENERSLKTDAQ